MPCSATSSSGRYAVVSVTTAGLASELTRGGFYHSPVPSRPMGKTLVTGATGFLGSHVVRALAGRGDELRLLVRRGSDLEHLSDLDFERTAGDVTDRRSVRRAMEGTERVF